MTTLQLRKWNNSDKSLTALQIANAIVKASGAAVSTSQRSTIRPIVEFFPIKSTESRGGARFELFPAGKNDEALYRGLRTALSKSDARGIFIFYDTRGRAIYVGKTNSQSLWAEMKNVFNRERKTQSVYRVAHPSSEREFIPAFTESRQPKKTDVRLNEIAAYFSAYQIDEGMIDDFEALVVRAFANDLLNVKMERFQHVREAQQNHKNRRRRKRKQ
jgi:hypothetical protein